MEISRHMSRVALRGHRAIDVGIIEIRGEEAHSWLQGQVSADVGAITEPKYTLLLSPKGRCTSDGWVIPIDAESIDFVVPAHAADDALARLERYLVMEDVELELRRATLFHVLGEEPPSGVRVSRIGERGWDAQEPMGVSIDDASWERARIDAGVPEHGRDFGEHTLPQEAGLKRAISFQKGCYIGQEPVVMLEHRGQPPRRLARVRVEGVSELPIEIQSEGAVAGTLSSWVDGVGLALIKRKRLDAPLRVNDQDLEILAILGDED